MWTVPHVELARVFGAAAKAGGLEELGLVLYCLRHGSASDDALRKFRTMAEIKRRLRHRSDASMRRYEKASRAQAEAGKIPVRSRRLGEAVGANLAALMNGNATVPTF